jgi:quinol monooxygenase YgiN
MIRKAEQEIVCVAQFTAKAGKEQELLETLQALMQPTHQESGYIRYELNQHIDNPAMVAFIEKFKSREDFDRHCAMPYIKGFFEKMESLVESHAVNLYREVLP